MPIKQEEEYIILVKDQNDLTDNYILRKNRKTKLGAPIITVLLVIILLGITIYGIFMNS